MYDHASYAFSEVGPYRLAIVRNVRAGAWLQFGRLCERRDAFTTRLDEGGVQS